MFKKKKKKQEELEEIKPSISGEREREPEVHVRIRKEEDYAVLEPLDLWGQKETSIEQKPIISKEVMEIRRKKPKKKIVVKKKIHEKIEAPKPVKTKLIIKKPQPEQIEPKKTIQKVLPKPPEKVTEPEAATSKIPIDQIETDIDKLMEIIDEKKIVGLDYLSKALKISTEKLEVWAKMLEDRGLIEIEYPIIGLPKLRKKEWKQKP